MSNELALVSVIVPAYNYASFLAEAVQSVRGQSHHHLEVIIVDDGSTDDTANVADILVKQDPRIRYFYQHNQGLSAARNTGMQKAAGEFIVFLDADDVMHPEKIQTHLEHFTQMPDAEISYGRSRYFLSGNRDNTFASLALDNEDWMPCVSGNAITVMPALVVNNIMPVCSAMLRREVLARVGNFDTSLKSLEDWDYWLRAAANNCCFCFCDNERLATYIRVHGTSMSANTTRMLKTQYRLRLENIPRCIAIISDKALASILLRDNRKRRLRCLTTIAGEAGIFQQEFWRLSRGESPAILLKMLNRLLRARLAHRD